MREGWSAEDDKDMDGLAKETLKSQKTVTDHDAKMAIINASKN